MKKLFFICLCFINLLVNAQLKKNKSIKHRFTESEKYFSFNPLALAEPQIAIGGGFGNRFSERSEYFTELSYVAKHPFYDMPEKSLHGLRFIAQYRYHFLQQWRPLINLGQRNRERRARQNPFVGVEFRVKPFNFTNNGTFYIGISAGKLIINNEKYYAISLSSPIGSQLKGKQSGDMFILNGKQYKIEKVS